MSNEIIKILDDLGRRFGVMIDWSSKNIEPYITDIMSRLTTYKIIANSIGVGIGVLCLIATIWLWGALICSYKKCMQTEKDTLLIETYSLMDLKYKELTEMGRVVVFSAIPLTIATFIVLPVCIISLLKWVCIPELQMIDYVTSLLK